MIEFDIHLVPELIHRVNRRRIIRPALLLGVGWCLVAAAAYPDLRAGRVSNQEAIALTALTMAALVFLGVYLFQRRATNLSLKRIGSGAIHYVLTDEAVSVASHLGKTELLWTTFNHLEIAADATRLKWEDRGALTLPTEQIPPAARSFLLDRFRQHGLKVTGTFPSDAA